MTAPAETDRLVESIDALLDALQDHADPAVRASVSILVDALKELHAEALRRLVALLAEDPARFDRALADPLVANVLLLYDLIRPDERRLAEAALESVRSMAQGHGGGIELLDVADGVVRVRLDGACAGCPSSSATLRHGVERALRERLPGYLRLEVEGRPGPEAAREALPGTGIPLGRIPEQVLYGTLVDEEPVLIVRRGADFRAYRNACPESDLPLHLGALRDGVIHCPWHDCRFDAATGARVVGDGPPLARLPTRVVGGTLRVGEE